MRKDVMITGYEIMDNQIIIKYEDGIDLSYRIDENSLNYMGEELSSLVKLNGKVMKGATLFSYGYLTLIFTIIAFLVAGIMAGITLNIKEFLLLLMSSMFVSAVLIMVGIKTDKMKDNLSFKQEYLIKKLDEIENKIREQEKINSNKRENNYTMIKPMKHEIVSDKKYVKTRKIDK